MQEQGCAVIVGVGARAGVGGAVAVRAAREGLHVFVAGRTADKLSRVVLDIEAQGGRATAVITDSTNAEQISALFEQAAASGLPLRLVVYNTGRNLPAGLMESDQRLIEGHWRRCVLGATLVGQAAVARMLEQSAVPELGHRGTIIYTGASASWRGKPLFAAFAAAKAAQRALAQSMAREFGPKAIHVGHVVIDGLVDGAVVRSVGLLGKAFLRNKGTDGALRPDEVAESFWMLHEQPRTAWTHELDLRPFKESF